MPINNTIDPQNQEEMLKKRLTNLIIEIDAHTIKRNALNAENTTLTKRLDYLKEEIVAKEDSVSNLNKKMNDAQSELSHLQTVKDNQLKELAESKMAQEKKQNALDTREDNVKNTELEVTKVKQELLEKLNQLAKDRTLVDKKQQVLSEALKALNGN